ncbi:MAG: hypothetical protein Q7J38_09190 [Gallionella sp.]|nr:hypothetical protein [Gallionella sp.]
MVIIYNKSLCSKLQNIVQTNVGAYLIDEVAALKAKQRKSASINRGPLYLEIANNVETRVFQEDSPRAINITPFIYESSNDDVALWLGFVVRFDYSDTERDFVLTSVSISLIRGSQTKVYLLRAEWDSRSGNANHAQPHWHAITGQAVFNNTVEERWRKIQSNLHLAMCARWRVGADSGNLCHTHGLHEEDVVSWVAKVLDYMKQQLMDELGSLPPNMEPYPEPFFKD